MLVADDDRAIRESLGRLLALSGYQVAVAADGPQALDAVRRHPYDVVVLDVMLPGEDGLSVCRTLRSEGDVTPILVVTADPCAWPAADAAAAGADDFLAKPFDADEFLARLQALLLPDGADASRRARTAVQAAAATGPRPPGTARAPGPHGPPGQSGPPGPPGRSGRSEGPVRVGLAGLTGGDRTVIMAALACTAGLLALGVITRAAVPGTDAWLHAVAVRDRGQVSAAAARAVTLGGSALVVWPLLVMAALIFPTSRDGRRWRDAATFAAASGVAIAARLALSRILQRPRPPLVDWAGQATGYAFPSGHTTSATLGAGALAWALSRHVRRPRRRLIIWMAAAAYAAAVGWSRVWLGVHWPLDVVGGWLFGAGWLTAMSAALRIWVRHRRGC